MSNSNKGSRPESERHDLNNLYDKIRTNDSLEPPHNSKDTHKNSPFSSTSSLGHPSEGYTNSEDSWSLVSQDDDEINFNDIVSTDGSAEGDYYEGNQNEGEGNQDGPTPNHFHLQDGSKSLEATFANLDEQLDKTEADIKEQMQVSINSRISRLSVSTLEDMRGNAVGDTEGSTYSIPKIVAPTTAAIQQSALHESFENLPDVSQMSQSTRLEDTEVGIVKSEKMANDVTIESIKVDLSETSKSESDTETAGHDEYGKKLPKSTSGVPPVNINAPLLEPSFFLSWFLKTFAIITVIISVIGALKYKMRNNLILSIKNKAISPDLIPQDSEYQILYEDICYETERKLLFDLSYCCALNDDSASCFSKFHSDVEQNKDFCQFSIPEIDVMANAMCLQTKSTVHNGEQKEIHFDGLDLLNKFAEEKFKQAREGFNWLKPKLEILGKYSVEQAESRYHDWLKPRLQELKEESAFQYKKLKEESVNQYKELKDEVEKNAESGYIWLKPKLAKLQEESKVQSDAYLKWFNRKIAQLEKDSKRAHEDLVNFAKERRLLRKEWSREMYAKNAPKLRELHERSSKAFKEHTEQLKEQMNVLNEMLQKSQVEYRSKAKKNYFSSLKDCKKSLKYLKKRADAFKRDLEQQLH
ncbi:unnamed protein product [Ambrosiozyma monospora]|uniref:Unnamed protein product n=1 Tax=Ambrosiozyma monospora TaxID=43982 RepID=A0A9W7DL12_AMBMO|nr:unnamed protein product [Ambrosiozyma monospora]